MKKILKNILLPVVIGFLPMILFLTIGRIGNGEILPYHRELLSIIIGPFDILRTHFSFRHVDFAYAVGAMAYSILISILLIYLIILTMREATTKRKVLTGIVSFFYSLCGSLYIAYCF